MVLKWVLSTWVFLTVIGIVRCGPNPKEEQMSEIRIQEGARSVNFYPGMRLKDNDPRSGHRTLTILSIIPETQRARVRSYNTGRITNISLRRVVRTLNSQNGYSLIPESSVL